MDNVDVAAGPKYIEYVSDRSLTREPPTLHQAQL